MASSSHAPEHYNDCNLIFIIGLPGSGKTTLARRRYPDYMLLDDPRAQENAPRTAPKFESGKKYVVCDPHLCRRRIFKQVASFYPEAYFVFMANDARQCLLNIERRNDGRIIPEAFLRALSSEYDIDAGIRLVKYGETIDVWRPPADGLPFDPM